MKKYPKIIKQKDIDEIKRGVTTVKTEVSSIKQDVTTLKYDVKQLKENLDNFKKQSNEKLDKIYTLVDGFAGEVKTYREEQSLVGEKLSGHNDRIEKLEKRVGLSSPS